MATELQKAGYGIRRTARGWEVSGISDEAVELFSRRTAEIEETIRREASKLETRALSVMLETGKTYAQAYEQAKSEVGALTRDDKDKGIPYYEALQRWKEQLGADGLNAVRSARGHADDQVRTFDQALKHAVADGFARESVLRERLLVAGILKAGVGGGQNVERIEEALKRPAFVAGEIEGKRYVTTTEVLSEERRVVDQVRHGMGKHEKIGLDQGWAIRREWLSAEHASCPLGKARSGASTNARPSAWRLATKFGSRVEALKARAQARETTLRAKRAQVNLSPSESMGLKHPEPGPLVEYVNLRAMNHQRLSPSVQQGLDRLRRWSREQASEAATNRRERIRQVMLRRKRAEAAGMERGRGHGMSR